MLRTPKYEKGTGAEPAGAEKIVAARQDDGGGGRKMATEKKPTTIKKYANRRLYDTGTSTYVTLEDLAAMVKRGEDFVVCDAKTGEDITRPVLTQIIFEQEGKDGQSLLPIASCVSSSASMAIRCRCWCRALSVQHRSADP